MKIVVTSNGTDLGAETSPVFGRCPAYVLVDTDTMQFEPVQNPAIGARTGAGIQAAQFVIEHGAQAVVTASMGPNAYGIFRASKVPVYLFDGGTVREAVEAYVAGRLQPMSSGNVPAYTGIGGGRGMGRGRGRGGGMGMGRGKWRASTSPESLPSDTPSTASHTPQDQEAAALRYTAQRLREQLAQIEESLRQLEHEDQA
jgi:predicted Fe-Mo cluster-binding NifX family protein